MADEIINDAEGTEAEAGNGNDGGENEGLELPKWMSSLPDDLKTNKVLAQFKTIGEAGKTLAELRSDDKVLRIPSEDATDEEKAAYYQKLGRPDKAENYTITKPDLPEEIPYSPELETAYKQKAFELGLSNATAAALHKWFFDETIKGSAMQKEADKQAVEATVNALKDEWKGDVFKSNTAIAVRAFRELGKGHDEILEKKIDGIKLGDHPAFLKLFHEIGKSMLPDTALLGEGGGGESEISEEEQAKRMFPTMNKK